MNGSGKMVKGTSRFRRILAALMCFVLLFCCCAEALGEKKELKITGPEVVAKNKKITLKANQDVKWKTSDKEIATVSEDGVVKGLKAGTVKITAVTKSKPRVKKTIKITVLPKAVKEITITAPYKKLDLEDKKTVTLSASASPKAAYQVFKWTSSNKKVAKVSSKGKVTAVGEGKAKITAEALDGSGLPHVKCSSFCHTGFDIQQHNFIHQLFLCQTIGTRSTYRAHTDNRNFAHLVILL